MERALKPTPSSTPGRYCCLQISSYSFCHPTVAELAVLVWRSGGCQRILGAFLSQFANIAHFVSFFLFFTYFGETNGEICRQSELPGSPYTRKDNWNGNEGEKEEGRE